jgi:hypothetical protein
MPSESEDACDDDGPWNTAALPISRRSAKHDEHAEVMSVLKALSATREPEPSEDDPPIVRDQRPAIPAGPKRKAIDQAMVEAARILKFERSGFVR